MWISAMPESRITSIWWVRSGWLRIGRIGFGLRSEKGYIRAPLPAARMTPAMRPSRSATRLFLELAAHELPHDAHGVEGANLLALLERTAADTHWRLGEPRAALRQPRRELRLEVEAVGLDVHALDERRPIHLVAGHQIRHLRPVEQSSRRAHEQVAHAVGEPHPFDRSLEPAAIDDVGAAGEDRLEQRHVVPRIVFQVSVLVDVNVAGRECPEMLEDAAAPDVLGHEDDRQARQMEPRQDVARPVLRAVVAGEDFQLEAGVD